MKKIFTLMFSLAAITAVFAQSHGDKNKTGNAFPGQDNHSVVYKDNKPANDNRYNTYSNDFYRKEAIEKVNRDYDFQIAAVKKNKFMTRKEKDRQIQRLEKERAMKIRDIYERFSDKKDVHGNNRNDKRF